MLTSILCFLVLAFGVVLDDEPDLIVLADGTEISCRVLYEDEDKVIARAKRKKREYPRVEVTEIHSIERSLREFLERFSQTASNDVGALADLALYCESNELPGEARSLWIRILLLDPENERAWTKLGGSNGRKGWRLKVRGRYYTLEQLKERVSDWKNAMEIPTAHFLVKTDIDPTQALDVTLDIERGYLALYDLFIPHLELFPFDEIQMPEVHIFSNAEDYKSPPTPGDSAWFSISANTLYVNGSEDRDPGQIMATFSDLLVFNAFRRTLGRTGSLSPWARKGLGIMMATAVQRDPGRARWIFGTPYTPYFRQQLLDPDALKLKDVLSAGNRSFDSGTNAERMTVQSYTLLFFLAYGREGGYRAGLAEFLRSSFMGQGAATHLRKALGVDLEQIEAEWKAYVEAQAAG